jgi:hypothetical protein
MRGNIINVVDYGFEEKAGGNNRLQMFFEEMAPTDRPGHPALNAHNYLPPRGFQGPRVVRIRLSTSSLCPDHQKGRHERRRAEESTRFLFSMKSLSINSRLLRY